MKDTLSIDSAIVVDLLHSKISNLNNEQMKSLCQVLTQDLGNDINKLLKYLEDPNNYKHPEHGFKVGDLIHVKIEGIYSSESKKIREQYPEMIVNDTLIPGEIMSFNVITGSYATIKFKVGDEEHIQEIYEAYLKVPDFS